MDTSVSLNDTAQHIILKEVNESFKFNVNTMDENLVYWRVQKGKREHVPFKEETKIVAIQVGGIVKVSHDSDRWLTTWWVEAFSTDLLLALDRLCKSEVDSASEYPKVSTDLSLKDLV